MADPYEFDDGRPILDSPQDAVDANARAPAAICALKLICAGKEAVVSKHLWMRAAPRYDLSIDFLFRSDVQLKGYLVEPDSPSFVGTFQSWCSVPNRSDTRFYCWIAS